MTPHVPYPPLFVFAMIGPIVYWAIVLILVLASVCSIAFTLRRPRRVFVYVAAGTLAAAVAMAAFPSPQAPTIVGALLGIACLVLAVAGGGPAVQLVLALASRGSVAGEHGGIVVPGSDSASSPGAPHEVLRGGTTIGLLERLATAGAIMAGFPTAIAVLVAVKGVGRFSELDAAEARERFIIGTLVSLIWACACAAVFHLAIR
jgi:hypothetical protein